MSEPYRLIKTIETGIDEHPYRIQWSPDGSLLGVAVAGTLQIWNVAEKALVSEWPITEASRGAIDFCWSPDGKSLAVLRELKFFAICDAFTGKVIWENIVPFAQLKSPIWSPIGNRLATGARDGTLRLWDTTSGQLTTLLKHHKGSITSIAWSPNSLYIATGGGGGGKLQDYAIRIWDLESETVKFVFEGHSKNVTDLVWSQNSEMLASASIDNTVRIWDTHTGKIAAILEGHTKDTRGVSFSPDENVISSYSWDGTFRIWKNRTFNLLATIKLQDADRFLYSRAIFHPTMNLLALIVGKNVQIWEIDTSQLIEQADLSSSVRYTTAKIVLVGDSGVGKTGLGWRLAHGEFKEHSSTHGQQFWVVDDLSTMRDDGTRCEAILWDLAGQHSYRSTHVLYLDKVDLALLVFDPTNRYEPLKGVEFWLNQLSGGKKLPPAVLVGARVDRGGSVLSKQELDQFCQEKGITGGYVEVSALTGYGLSELYSILQSEIRWKELTATITTQTFKRIKDFILSMKESNVDEQVLVDGSELRRQLQDTDPSWHPTEAEVLTALRHLENHGYVTIVHTSHGKEVILLAPERLVSLAASILLEVNRDPYQLGTISETQLMQGKYHFPEIADLEENQQRSLLDEVVNRFFEHKVCFRERLGTEMLLVFPGQIRSRPPLPEDSKFIDDSVYLVIGATENLYSALVVSFAYTNLFTNLERWRDVAQYEIGPDQLCGFRQVNKDDGQVELVIYYSETTSLQTVQKFRNLFERFLSQRDVRVNRYTPVRCINYHLQDRETVIRLVKRGQTTMFCLECGERIQLPSENDFVTFDSYDGSEIIRAELEVKLRSLYETDLTKVKSISGGDTPPSCYISYVRTSQIWVNQLMSDLANAGVYLITDIGEVTDIDFVLIVGIPAYQQAVAELQSDLDLLHHRLNHFPLPSTRIIPILREESASLALPELARLIPPIDFREDDHYILRLYDLILMLYAVPFNHPVINISRESLIQNWETVWKTISARARIESHIENDQEVVLPLTPQNVVEEGIKSMRDQIFISYSHKDKKWLETLQTHLKPLTRNKTVVVWNDTQIKIGANWKEEIEKALISAKIGIMLVTPNFLASDFIADEEIPALLKAAKEDGAVIFWIAVSDSQYKETELRHFQCANDPSKPLDSLPAPKRNAEWTKIMKKLKDA